MNDTVNKPRIIVLDLLRVLSMIAIIHFHIHETIFYRDINVISEFDRMMQPYSRFLAFSGHTVIALSAFLLGFGSFNYRRLVEIAVLCTVGILVIGAAQADPPQWFLLEWDIYQFLLVSFGVLFLLRHSPDLIRIGGGIGMILLWLPLWQWIEPLMGSGLMKDVLIGDCSQVGKGAWPLLPWIGLPLLFFACGREVQARGGQVRLNQVNGLIWIVLLALSCFWLGAYFKVPLGPGFNCFVLRREPVEMWAHLIWIVFFLFVGLDPRVNQILSRLSVLRFVSKLHWSRHFGECYILQFVVLLLANLFFAAELSKPLGWNSLFFAAMLIPELISRLKFALTIFVGGNFGPR